MKELKGLLEIVHDKKNRRQILRDISVSWLPCVAG